MVQESGGPVLGFVSQNYRSRWHFSHDLLTMSTHLGLHDQALYMCPTISAAMYMFVNILNSAHPWGLEATKIVLDSRISAAQWYGSRATGVRFQDEFLLRWSITSLSSSERESSSKRKEFRNYDHH